MRLFIAVNFNDDTRNKLITIKDELRANSIRGSFTLPENLHLTLAFIGECNAAQVDDLKSILDKINFESFDLTIERIGCFKRNDGDLWWAGIKESPNLTLLHRDILDKLKHAGFPVENRKYSPHITLGRKVVINKMPSPIVPFNETIAKIELMESKRFNGKLTYISIHEREGH